MSAAVVAVVVAVVVVDPARLPWGWRLDVIFAPPCAAVLHEMAAQAFPAAANPGLGKTGALTRRTPLTA